MSGTMVKKQLESSDIQTGACHYCGQIYQFETDGRATEEQLDRWAEEKCDCTAAKIEQKKRKKAEQAKEKICQLFHEGYPEVASLLISGVDMLIEGKAVKVTVDTGVGAKLAITINSKGNIKAEIAKTAKSSVEV